MSESVRDSFVETFGEETADKLYAAAVYHGNGINDHNKGSDSFKWALAITIGYECFTRPEFAAWHKINPEAGPAIKQWIKDEGHLESHDGDFDYLSLLDGHYTEYMKESSIV